EEELTEDQIDLICGTYRVRNNSEHPSLLSWFPKPNSWATSSLDVGFWSADDETWYQQRVRAYLDGTKGP
ncbi:hypothetical protein BDZ89DRAFT_893743, partial [Hymenopellis radicata]